MQTSSPKPRADNVLWIASRFIVFGIGGFLVMLVCWATFLGRVTGGHAFSLSPLLSVPLTVLGAVAMLFGVGEWGRWAYLFVFLSIPLSMCLWFLPMFEHAGKEFGVTVPAVAALITYSLARQYYSRRKLSLR